MFNKCFSGLLLPRLANDTILHDLSSSDFKIPWNRPWGAISITMTFFGTFWHASENKTVLLKLFAWYCPELHCAKSLVQLHSGIEVDIHLEDLCLGLGTA